MQSEKNAGDKQDKHDETNQQLKLLNADKNTLSILTVMSTLHDRQQ